MSNQSSMPKALGEEFVGGTNLTRGEKRVLRLLARGFTYRETAKALEIGLESVKSQSESARRRLRARNTAHAIAIAVSLDMI